MNMLCVVVFVVSLIDAEAFTQEMWANTVHAFEDQAMISQKITKEFLMGVTGQNNAPATNGSNRLLEEAGNSSNASTLTSIELFDKHLQQVIHGDPAHGILSQADMGILVQTAMATLTEHWNHFKPLIEQHANTYVALSVLVTIAEDSRKIMVDTEDVMNKIVIMEEANGATAELVVVTIARRQTMLMQKMLKEVLLIGLGVDVSHNLHYLHETEIAIDGANKGIILGATWAGVAPLEKFCTLNEMTKVTTKWALVKPLADEVIGAGVANGQAVATRNSHQVVASGDDLEHEMEVAVALYMHDDGSCNIVDSITTADWKYLLNSVDLQRYYGQRLTLQVLQVANNVSIQASKVDLTINMATTYASMRTLIEGDPHHSSPPTQKIVDELILAHKVWQELSNEFDTVIFTTVVDPIMVEKVIRLSAELVHDMDVVMDSYLTQVAIADSAVPAHMIATAGKQRMLFQELALEAAEIKFYVDHNMNTEALHTLDLLNSTRDHWLTTHWGLLQGDPANNVPEMTNLCIIKQMKEVKDSFDELKTAAWRVAFGEKEQITEMIRILPIAHGLMDTAVGYYANGVQTCPVVMPTLEAWEAGIVASGVARTSSQKTAVEYLWNAQSVPGPNAGAVLATFWGADGTIGEGMVNAITKLRFGWGADDIPAPYNDELREEIAKVSVIVTKFSGDLLLSSSANVVFDSKEMEHECELLVAVYLNLASASFPNLPANRIELSIRLEYLANKMLKEALQLRVSSSSRRLRERRTISSNNNGSTIVIDRQQMLNTMLEYDRIENTLKEGDGGSVPKLITQRPDIKAQQERVAAQYLVFHGNVLCVSENSCVNTLTTKESLNDLEKELAAATLLYYLEDPIVPEVYPWTVVIYIIVTVLVCAVVGSGGCRGFRDGRTDTSGAGAGLIATAK